MDNRSINIDECGEEAVQSRMQDFIANIPEATVNDDKTIVVMINTSTVIKWQPDEYYVEPDWAALKEEHDKEWRRQAYPHMYKPEDDDEKPEDDIPCDVPAKTEESKSISEKKSDPEVQS